MIEKNIFGKTGINISRLGIGCMRFPQDEKGIIDQEQTNSMIKLAMESGVNYYDTAPVYGDGKSETALGIALKPYDRSTYYIATKCPVWELKDTKDVERILDECLIRLQTDHVDFFLLHALNKARLKNVTKDVFKELDRLKKIGKIKHVGFSIHAPIDVLKEILDMYDFEFAQIEYNYLDEDDAPGKAGYEEIEKRGLPCVIMEPVKGGIIANLSEKVGAPIKKISNASFASLGYRWVLDHSNAKVILSGSSSIEQITENIATFSEHKPLSKEEYKAIEEVKELIRKTQKVACTACRYCMPCPFGVNIPHTFANWNKLELIDSFLHSQYSLEDAEKCKDCKACVSKCPQRINIPEIMKQIRKEI